LQRAEDDINSKLGEEVTSRVNNVHAKTAIDIVNSENVFAAFPFNE